MTERDLEQRLRSAIRDGVDSSAPPWLQAHIQAIPHTIPTTRRGASPSWLSLGRSRGASVALISAMLVALSVALGVFAWRNIGTAPPTPPSPATWSGPVRPDAAGMPVLPFNEDANGLSWVDARDAAVPWVDIRAVRWSGEGQFPNWSIELGDWPPRADGLDPTETVIEYGVVLDTNRDRVPDYEFGINNDAPEAGDFKVWVTDIAAGHTSERLRAPYGFPVEFGHPDEYGPDDTMNGQPSMYFTFLPGSRPVGPPDKVGPTAEWQFYVWATLTEDGEVVAWDYGPDYGWLSSTGP